MAALGVVFFHAGNGWMASPGRGGLLHVVQIIGQQGWFGVHLFFVISGYCIGARSAQDCRQGRRGGLFLLDRAWRIFPVYWAALLAAAFLALLAAPFNHVPLVSLPGRPGSFPSSLAAACTEFTLMAPWFGRTPWLLVSWSLTSEISFYLLVAFGLLLTRAFRSPLIAVGMGMGLAFALALKTTSSPLNFWPEFTCGFLAWLASRLRERSNHVAVLCWLAIFGLGAIGLWRGSPAGTLPWAAGFALILIALQRHDPAIAAWSALRWLGGVGAFSYSLYLIHLPIVSPARNLAARVWPVSAPSFVIVVVGLTLAAIVAGWIFYRCIESPLERLRKGHRRPAPVREVIVSS